MWKLSKEKDVEIFATPGNGGISQVAECIDIKADNIEELRNFAIKNKIDLTIVGPELPLSLGIVNAFCEANLKIFGPTKEGAILESSKAFAKDFFSKYNIPTAKYKIFSSFEEAKKYVENLSFPVVIKADGLAAGKGSIV